MTMTLEKCIVLSAFPICAHRARGELFFFFCGSAGSGVLSCINLMKSSFRLNSDDTKFRIDAKNKSIFAAQMGTFCWVGLGWVGLGWVGVGLGWVGLGWVGLGWVGLGWVGVGVGLRLGWVGTDTTQLKTFVSQTELRAGSRLFGVKRANLGGGVTAPPLPN